ncbi:MAG: PEP-CTERM sorting domain-containing protein, partial [Phycisphaerales bacterium]|nr:PEP-CTERM sorting domain-containing protein [Phycisphaerales bacterium]
MRSWKQFGLLAVAVAVCTSAVSADIVSTGWFHTLAIQDGAVYAWGENFAGQLGDGTYTSSSKPVAITLPGVGDVTAIAAGGVHSLAVRGGVVYACGQGGAGQLGLGYAGYHNVPMYVMEGVTAVAAGDNASVAVKGGGVWAFGDGFGLAPVQVFDTILTDIVEVAIFGASFYALGSDGDLWAWGDVAETWRAEPMLMGTGYTSIGGFGLAGRSGVPEPASLGVLALGAVGLILRR